MGGGECLQFEVSPWTRILLLHLGKPYDNCKHFVAYDPPKIASNDSDALPLNTSRRRLMKNKFYHCATMVTRIINNYTCFV